MSSNNEILNNYDELLRTTDIVDVISRYIDVVKAGKNHKSVCPFHNDTNPSMMINGSKQIFKCFVCGTGGNAINFVEKYEKISYRQAAAKVADLVGFDSSIFKTNTNVSSQSTKDMQIYACLNDITQFYQFNLLTKEGQEARNYLTNRNIDENDIKMFKIGLAPEDGHKTIEFLKKKNYSIKVIEETGIISDLLNNPIDRNYGRIIFPLSDEDGRTVGFSGRRYKQNDTSPKYVNSPETKVFHKSNVLYNYDNAKIHARNTKYLYVLEGFMDVIALVKAGFNATVAIMGTAFTPEHLKLIKLLNVELRICLDGDYAGQLAMMKMVPLLDNARINYSFVANYDDNRDPDDVFRAEGKEGLEKYLLNLVGKTDFSLNYLIKSLNLKNLDDRKKLVNQIMPLISKLESKLEVDDYINKVASITNFSTNILYEMYKNTVQSEKNSANSQLLSQNVDIYGTFHGQISALKKAERTILLQMLNDKKAIDFYKTEIKTFIDEVYRYFAYYLVANRDKDNTNSYSSMINLINADFSDDEEKINKYTAEVTDLFDASDGNGIYNEGLLKDSKRRIDKQREKDLRKRKVDEAKSKATTNIELAKNLQEAYKKKKR